MKTIVGMWVVCGLALAGSAMAAGEARAPSAQDIAAKPELIVAVIRHQNAQDSATVVGQALAAIFASDWQEANKRSHVISLVTYAVATKGKDAAPMMGLVAAGMPPAWLAVVAATAVMAGGDNSPAVANAMLAAVAGNAQAVAACRTACASPSTVLSPTEIGMVRAVTLPTPPQAPAKAPPLPTIIQPAEKYPGQ